MSSGLVTDQKPGSPGNSLKRSVQWTGHSWRRRLNSSCGGPPFHSSRSVTRTFSRSTLRGSLPTVAILGLLGSSPCANGDLTGCSASGERLLARAPDLARVAADQRPARGAGEVELASSDERPAVDDRHAHGARTEVQRD